MARPKSMPDFTSLLDASSSPPVRTYENERPRKKPSISLAAGLIMASSESNSAHASPRSAMMPPPAPPPRPSSAEKKGNYRGEWSEGLFYAYAQKVLAPLTHLLLHQPLFQWQSEDEWLIVVVLCSLITRNLHPTF
jgi:hypothetical protein